MAQHGRYKIIKRVADGGMAEIFLATQLGREGFAKPVILKRIHSTIYADPQFRNMFIDEAHISMSLSHSNIAQVLDLGVSAGRYFLALELVDGWDLGRVLHRAATAGVRLPRELALHVTAEVCRALAYAHSKTEGQTPLGIVHRDVSPHNILLSEQGEVKLTDFGIAKAMNKREHTGTGVVKGKVAFMSPEQAMGKPIDQRSDLFSVGTVLYLMVTRSRPFEGPSDLETLLRVQKGDFRPPEETAPDLPPEVAAVVARAMRKEPGRPLPERRRDAGRRRAGAADGVPAGRPDRAQALADRAVGARRRHADQSVDRDGRARHLDADQDRDRRAGRGGRRPARHRRRGHRRRGGDLAGGGQGGEISRPRATRVAPDLAGSAGARGRRIDVEPLGSLGARAADPRRGRGTAGPSPRPAGQRVLHPLRRRAAGGGRLVRRQVRPDVPDLVRRRRDRQFGGFGQLEPAAATDHAGAQPTAGALPTDKQAAASRDAAAAPRGAETAEAPAPARHAEPAAAHEAGHETAARRRGGERSKDFVGRDLAGLKMAPDPVPAAGAGPAAAPKNADSPPSAPPASENP